MRRWLYLLLIVMAAGMLTGFSYPERSVKATWLWQTEQIADDADGILAFCRQQGVNLLYLRIDPDRPAAYYRSFVKRATEAGIAVHALGGHPSWGLAENRTRLLRLVEWVKAYNQEVEEAERFQGVHVTVEPYLLPQWRTDRTSVLRQWQANIEAFVAAVKSAPGLEAGADLAIWLDQVPAPDQPDLSFSAWMIRRLDHVTLLAYRDHAEGSNGILASVEQELREAEAADTSVIVGVNVKQTDADETSFAEEGEAAMKRELGVVDEQLAGRAAYAGYAVHDLKHWRELVPSVSSGQATPPAVRATYVWHAELVIQEPEQIIQFAREHGVNLLYARLDLQQPFEAYRSFVREARAAGIEVHAMGGHPVWALEENRDRVLRFVDYVRAYNASVAPEERFAGVHLDVEPYVMPLWWQDREAVIRQWMGNLEAFVEAAKREPGLETSADMAFWFDNIPTPGQPDVPFYQWMISKLDHTTVMAFRDHADGPGGIVDVARREMDCAEELGKRLVIAVEMKESREGAFITFYEEGKAEMERQLQLAEEAFSGRKAFAGVAVHAYDYWKQAKE